MLREKRNSQITRHVLRRLEVAIEKKDDRAAAWKFIKARPHHATWKAPAHRRTCWQLWSYDLKS